MLILLDLSAAFDTIDQGILLSRLSNVFGTHDKALRWIKSYLTNRSQAVRLEAQETSSSSKKGNRVTSDPVQLSFGVPQGSVLGPLLFTLYTAPLSELITRHGMQQHLNADDTQIYLAIKDVTDAISSIQSCTTQIKDWMTVNKLRMNDSKTEVMLLGPKVQRNRLHLDSLMVGDSEICVPITGSIRNLGAYFDSDLSMNAHVTKVCQAIHFHLRNIGKVRKYLDFDTTTILVHSMVTNRLDYCNSLLVGIPKQTLNRLQMVQNHAARLITLSKRRDHVQPILKSLHWLPIAERVIFKVALLVYKCLHNLAPKYLEELLQRHVPARPLRSSSMNRLVKPPHRLKHTEKAFSVGGPNVWNALSLKSREAESLSTFKANLKTEVFKKAFEC